MLAQKKLIKGWLDANVWDGEDRSGCTGDSAVHNPDDLQELVEDCFDSVFEDLLKQETEMRL